MPFKFIHTADIHLDSPLKTLALRDPELGELIGSASRQVFSNIVTLCLDENVDALMIAGDLYDGDQTSMKTALFLAEQMHRLDKAGIAVFIIRGNHDALSRITRELILPDSVKVFGGRGQVVMLERAEGEVPVAVHGLSFSNSSAPESLLPKYSKPVAGAINIALMHTSLAGAEGHDNYAPCKLADLHNSGHQYWGLGHIHKRDVYKEPGSVVVMPGIPQGRDIGESGPKSVTLVTCQDDGQVTHEERLTSIAQFERVDVDVDGIDNWRDIIARITHALTVAREATASEHLVARVKTSGRTPVAWKLRRDSDLLKTQLEQRALSIGNTWVEKVEVKCQSQVEKGDAIANPLVDLGNIITGTVIPSTVYTEKILSLLEEFRGKLPADCRDIFGKDEETSKNTLAQLCRDGADEVLARLHATENATENEEQA